MRVGAEGREWSQDVCEAVSVRRGGLVGKVVGEVFPGQVESIPWVKVKRGAHIPEGK